VTEVEVFNKIKVSMTQEECKRREEILENEFFDNWDKANKGRYEPPGVSLYLEPVYLQAYVENPKRHASNMTEAEERKIVPHFYYILDNIFREDFDKTRIDM